MVHLLNTVVRQNYGNLYHVCTECCAIAKTVVVVTVVHASVHDNVFVMLQRSCCDCCESVLFQ